MSLAVSSICDLTLGDVLLSPFVLAELDHLVRRRLGRQAGIDLLDDVDAGVYTLVGFSTDDFSQAVATVKQYGDLDVGIPDASVAVLAGRYRSVDILSVDERHFRAMPPCVAETLFVFSLTTSDETASGRTCQSI